MNQEVRTSRYNYCLLTHCHIVSKVSMSYPFPISGCKAVSDRVDHRLGFSSLPR